MLPTYLHKLISELDNHISSEQLAAVMRTPFHQYWKIPDIPVSSRFIIAVLKQWDSNNTSLNIASKALSFTAEDLSVVLGIKAHGRQVQLRSLQKKSKTLRDLFKSSTTNADHQMLMEMLWMLAGRTDEEGVNDFVRTFVLMVFNTVLFPTKIFRIPPKLFVYVDNIEELACYNWGRAVHEFLVVSIRRFLEKKGLQKLIDQNNITYIDGCIVGVLVSDYIYI